MESELPSDQHFEDELGVKGQQKSYNPWALKCHRDNLRKIGIHLVKVRAPGIFGSISLLDPARIRILLKKFKNLFMMNFFKGCSKQFPEMKMYTFLQCSGSLRPLSFWASQIRKS
jgi:hypothetical protein